MPRHFQCCDTGQHINIDKTQLCLFLTQIPPLLRVESVSF